MADDYVGGTRMSAHTLLIVDDDPAVHELLAAVLHRPEWRIDSAYDGLEGLARVEGAPLRPGADRRPHARLWTAWNCCTASARSGPRRK